MIKYGTNNIGKIYFGSNPIGKAYLGSNLVYQSGSGPSPSQNIPYIRNTVDAYIDTGITPDNTTKVIVWARNLNPIGYNYTWLFGSRVAYNDAMFDLIADKTQQTGSIGACYGGGGLIDVANAWQYLSGYHKYELSSDGCYVDDTKICSVTTSTFSSNISIHLFGENTNGVHTSSNAPIDICACKIYKNNALVRNFTAVNSPSVGLYDSVSQTLFTNAGNGSLTYGTFNPNAYTPLEYVSCTDSYFDTGVYGTYSGGIVLKFMPTNTTPIWNAILGFRESNSSCDISLGTNTSNQDNMRCYWRFGANNTSSNAFSGSTSNKLTNKEVVAVKSDAALTLYYNNAQIGTSSKTGVSSSFQTAGTMGFGKLKNASGFTSTGFYGQFYYAMFSNTMSLVPALVNNVAGMYDTYNDQFHPSISGTDFTAGPTL